MSLLLLHLSYGGGYYLSILGKPEVPALQLLPQLCS